MSSPQEIILQVKTLQDFQRYQAGIERLLLQHAAVLMDDFSQSTSTHLLQNTASYIPWLWIFIQNNQVLGLSCLSDIIPGRHAYIHGISDTQWPKHPGRTQLAEQALQAAFYDCGVRKVKAEIEANNKGARGFCWRMGFKLEGRLKQDNRIQNIWHDVLIYSLFAESYRPLASFKR